MLWRMVKYTCIFYQRTVNLFGGTEMKRIRKMFRLLLSVLFFFLSLFGLYFTNRIMYIKKKDDQSILTREKEAGRFNPEDFDSLTKREVTIPSPFGYELKIILVEPNPANHYIIFSHGVTENKINSIKYMNLFLQR